MPVVSSRGIFLSYRHEDAAPYVRLLEHEFRERFPGVPLFIDLDSIEPGLDFAEVIQEALDSCAVLVALIGRQWVTLTDEQGRRRLDDSDDLVRFEIQTALERGVRVIPVLVDGAKPLRREQLPAELCNLARLNALDLSHDRYKYDVNRLLESIQRVLAPPGTGTAFESASAAMVDPLVVSNDVRFDGNVTSDSEHSDPSLQAQVNVALEGLLREDPAAEQQFKETTRVYIHLHEIEARTREADIAAKKAEQYHAAQVAKLDPFGYRTLGFAVGVALVILLTTLGAIPLNWAAVSFGLDPAATWIVTIILVVASMAALSLFKVTHGNARRRRILIGMVAVGYLALMVLRTEFLVTVAAEPLLVALIQAVTSTAITGGLIVLISAVLTRTRFRSLSRTRATVRRARQTLAERRDAQTQTAEMLQRNINALLVLLLPWPVDSAVPTDIDQTKWAALLERTIRSYFPTPSSPTTPDREGQL